MAAKEATPVQTVSETHEHEDGTLIGPAQQSPDPEELEEQRRPPSLGEILLREAEALQARKEAEREAQRKADEEAAAAKSAEPISITIPQIHAVANMDAPQPAVSGSKGLEERWKKHHPRARKSSNPRRATGDESTILVVGIPYGSSRSITRSSSTIEAAVTCRKKASPPVTW